MPDPSPRAVVEAYLQATNNTDWDRLAELLDPDYIEDYPQSGERIRGRENAIAIRRSFPGLDDSREPLRQRLLLGGEEHWALAPNFTAIRVTGTGETVTSLARARYPDGYWYIVYIATVQDGRIKRATALFAPLFDPPEWRQALTERMPEGER